MRSNAKASSAGSSRSRIGLGSPWPIASVFALALVAFLAASAPASAADCPNEAVRTEQGQAGLALPECRAYELVTPDDKNGSLPQFPVGSTSPLGFVGLGALDGAASNDGEQMIWLSMLPLPGATNGLPMSYESRRTPFGWKTEQDSPNPTDELPSAVLSLALVQDATDDLSGRIIPTAERYDPLTESAPLGRRDIYLQDAEHKLTWISRPDSGSPTKAEQAQYQGRTSDASHIFFSSKEKLVPAATGNIAGRILYDRTGGHTEMVDVESDGVTPTSTCGARLGYNVGSAIAGGVAQSRVRSAVSTDGSSIYFTSPDPSQASGTGCGQPSVLYLRRDGTTTKVSASQRATVDPLGPQDALFQGASDSGDIAYFMSSEALTEDAADGTGNELLYRYDRSTSKLTLVTPNASVDPLVRGVVEVSSDGSRVYFVASGSTAEPVTEADLYTWEGGKLTEIGPVGTNSMLYNSDSGPVDLSADGSRITFVSDHNLRGFDAGGKSQVYLYDAEDDSLYCPSCPGDGSSPSGDAALQRDAVARTQIIDSRPRNVVDEGNTVFFDTSTSLVPQDENGTYDVYEWHDGRVRLISSGHGREPSFFVDASADGRDVFFFSPDRLTPQDTNVDADFYDARVDGGFAGTPASRPVCAGSECQGPPGPPASSPAAASRTLAGQGNRVPRQGCRVLRRRARQDHHRVRKLNRDARRFAKHNEEKARRVRRQAKRLGKRAQHLSERVHRCKRANRGG